MTRRALCPVCKDADRGTNPAGRCDSCHAAVELRKTCCTDCLAEGREPKKCLPVDDKYPGRRCMKHGRLAKKAARRVAHARRVEVGYGITGEQYWALYAFQGGRCALCQVATGKTKRLAVDHDHVTGEVFGLCCGPCNIMLGRLGRRIDPYVRTINYLHDPPARRFLGPCFVPLTDAPEPANTPPPDGAKPTTTDGGEPATPTA